MSLGERERERERVKERETNKKRDVCDIINAFCI
jgi:hypothetical protein